MPKSKDMFDAINNDFPKEMYDVFAKAMKGTYDKCVKCASRPLCKLYNYPTPPCMKGKEGHE